MKAKFIACHDTTSQVIWFQNFVEGLKVVEYTSRPIKLYCDNSATVLLSKNNKCSSKSKHIELKYMLFEKKFNKKMCT